MGRLFVYDENMTDERAKITVAKMAAVSDIVASEKAFIQYSAAGQLTVLAGAVIAVGDAIFQTEETTLSAANLDGASSFAHGKDYYIYLCDNGKDSSNEVYLISENSTFPDGVEWDDTNTRKIGGFHYGFVRNVDEYGREVNTSGSVVAVGKVTCVRTLPLTLYGPHYTARSATRPVWHTWGMVCGLIFTLHQMMGRTAYNLYIMQRLLRVQRV